MSESKEQVKVKFFTRESDETLQCSSNPVFVPVGVKRLGLSQIVNHLLATETPIPFDFLINNTVLRTASSIEDYLVANGLSSETLLDVEYKRSVLPPSFLASFNNEDWISSIDTLPTMTTTGPQGPVVCRPKIITGAYDGVVRIYNMSGRVETQLVGHSAAIKSVKFISPTRFVSAGNDRAIRLWKAGTLSDETEEEENTQDGKTVAILEGHKAAVSSLDVEAEKYNRILSGGYDNTVGLWSTNVKEMSTIKIMDYSESSNLSTASRKRAKLAIKDSTIKRKSPLSFLESHTGPVEGVIFDPKDSTVGYSCSQDHTVKTWDLETSKCVDTRTTSYPLLSIASLSKINLIACGSSARHINLHDPRVGASDSVSQSQLIGHTNFVVSLATCKANEHMLFSGSHDGTAKVWDVRANKPLYTLTRKSIDSDATASQKPKVFAVAWEKEIGILSGGDDKKLQIDKFDCTI